MSSYMFSFTWMAPEEAVSGLLVARGLEGHEACGTFGITIATVNANGETLKEQDVCRNGIVSRG